MQRAMHGVRVVAIILVVVASAFVTAPAEARSSASIVMDMRDGKVVRARNADARLHPASLTKMMTLYLAFEAIRDGRLRLDQRVRVSRHAARQPASKLYLRAGQRVSVRHLIRAIALKSANDAAVVVAEAIGGSQSRFAKMMTARAQALGMRNTQFRNPHGLTQRGHYSSARDMAILARHLYFDFPKYYNIFSRRSDYAAGKRIWNTNRMLVSYDGMTGLKTGYTRAAGYNLAATAERGGKHIIVVQFGASSSADRTRRVRRLLDLGFERVGSRVRVAKPQGARRDRVAVVDSPEPRDRPGRTRTGIAAVAAAVAPSQAQAGRPASGARRLSAPAAETVISPSRLAPADTRMPAAPPRSRQIQTAQPAPPPGPDWNVPIPPDRPVRVARQGRLSWAAEIGPFDTESDALVQLAQLPETGVATLSKSPGGAAGSVFTIRFPFGSEAEAATICQAALARPALCRVVKAGVDR